MTNRLYEKILGIAAFYRAKGMPCLANEKSAFFRSIYSGCLPGVSPGDGDGGVGDETGVTSPCNRVLAAFSLGENPALDLAGPRGYVGHVVPGRSAVAGEGLWVQKSLLAGLLSWSFWS